MRSSAMMVAVVLLTASWGIAQSTENDEKIHAGPAASQYAPSQNDHGFFIVAEVTQSLNARKLKPGDRVKAEVAQDVLSHGRIVIPAETKLMGHVTEASARGKDNAESRLAIVFDKILLKHSREIDFDGVIRSVEAPALRRSRQDEPDPMMSPGAMARGSASRSLSSASAAASGLTAAEGTALWNGTKVSDISNTSNTHSAGGRPPTSERAASPLSLGMPFGVFGIKDLRLVAGDGKNGQVPVIVSSKHNVKLENGTQVLIRATNAHLATLTEQK